jgi:hypothetical protein
VVQWPAALKPGCGSSAATKRTPNDIRLGGASGGEDFMFACLIICSFQLVFLAETVFFSHSQSANSTFSHGFSVKRTCSKVSSFFSIRSSELKDGSWEGAVEVDDTPEEEGL